MTTTTATTTTDGAATGGQEPPTGTAGAPQEGTQGTGQESGTATSTSTDGAEGASTEGQGQEPGTDELARVRREAAAYRRQLREAEAERDQLRRAQMTDAERLAAERDELATQLAAVQETARANALRAEVIAAASAAGIRPDDALAFLAGAIDYDENGAPQGVADAVAALAKERPYLVQHSTPAQSGPGAQGSTGGGPVTYTRAQLADRAFYEANREDILRAANEGRIVG